MQAAKAAPSRLHWNVEPASVDVKLKLADVELLTAGGADVIVVSGAVSRSSTCGSPGGVGVSGRVGRAYLERVTAGRQARVAPRARAGSEGSAVEAALEGRARLVELKLKLGPVTFKGSRAPR